MRDAVRVEVGDRSGELPGEPPYKSFLEAFLVLVRRPHLATLIDHCFTILAFRQLENDAPLLIGVVERVVEGDDVGMRAAAGERC